MDEVARVRRVLLEYSEAGITALTMPAFPYADVLMTAAADLLHYKYGHSIDAWSLRPIERERTVNVWFFREDPGDHLAFYRGDCTYVGPHLVVCDAEFIESLQPKTSQEAEHVRRSFEAKGAPVPDWAQGLEEALSFFPKNVWFWVVLHELGHMARRHDAMTPEAAATTVIPVANGILEYPATEREADEFVCEVIETVRGPRASFAFNVANGINALVDQTLQGIARARGDVYDRMAQTPFVVPIPRSKRVPLVWRGALLYREIVRRFHHESPDYAENMVERLRFEIV